MYYCYTVDQDLRPKSTSKHMQDGFFGSWDLRYHRIGATSWPGPKGSLVIAKISLPEMSHVGTWRHQTCEDGPVCMRKREDPTK